MQFYIKIIPVILKEQKEIIALIIQTQLYLNRYNPISNSFTFAGLEFECRYFADAKYIFTNFSNDGLLIETQNSKFAKT